MRKCLLTLLGLLLLSGLSAQLDTIAAWTFPTGEEGDENANIGIEQNVGSRYVSAEDTTAWPNTVQREVTFTNGASDYAATADGWNSGANAKLWSVKVKTTGATGLRLYSKQRAGGNKAGPRDWKIQCRISGQDWIDVDGGEVTVGNDWTTGVVEDLPLPSELDGTTESVYVRWIMVSDTAINGELVEADGVAKIDDIYILGNLSTSISENTKDNDISVYPNPTSGEIKLSGISQFESLRVFDITGREHHQQPVFDANMNISLSHLPDGLYFIRLQNEKTVVSRKIIIRKAY